VRAVSTNQLRFRPLAGALATGDGNVKRGSVLIFNVDFCGNLRLVPRGIRVRRL
jgi:hypothetical protein